MNVNVEGQGNNTHACKQIIIIREKATPSTTSRRVKIAAKDALARRGEMDVLASYLGIAAACLGPKECELSKGCGILSSNKF